MGDSKPAAARDEQPEDTVYVVTDERNPDTSIIRVAFKSLSAAEAYVEDPVYAGEFRIVRTPLEENNE